MAWRPKQVHLRLLIYHVGSLLTPVLGRPLKFPVYLLFLWEQVLTINLALGSNNVDVIILQLSFTSLLNHSSPMLHKPLVWGIMAQGLPSCLPTTWDTDMASIPKSLLKVSCWETGYVCLFLWPVGFLGGQIIKLYTIYWAEWCCPWTQALNFNGSGSEDKALALPHSAVD